MGCPRQTEGNLFLKGPPFARAGCPGRPKRRTPGNSRPGENRLRACRTRAGNWHPPTHVGNSINA
eukprot:7256358-Lingulodinium_polyedra.AAC.1